MTNRLEVLKNSLTKKENELNRRFDNHFDDVRAANGQPLNDKRNGRTTLNRWDKQSNGIRHQQEEIEKTKRAIEREEYKISSSNKALAEMPKPIIDLVNSGILVQWRKHPNTFFVKGVEKARIVWKGGLFIRYLNEIPNQEQYAIFRDTFNNLNAEIKK